MRRFFTESDRLEAFSDGVIAVIITIMVLELRPPNSTSLSALFDDWPTFAAYALSFTFVGIYWNNHHHMLKATRGIDGRAMWTNLYLLFCLSLVPFATAWLGRNPKATGPTAVYAAALLMCAIAYSLLQRALLIVNGPDAPFAQAVKTDVKGYGSIVLYVLALAFAFFVPLVSDILFVVVAIVWFVPDRRFEPLIRVMDERE
ncbi:MAG: TMEM175 family protein [Candidatus Cybelea sp.]